MTSIKSIAAIVVVVIVVIAAAAYVILRDDGDGGNKVQSVGAIGYDVDVGDYYVLATSDSAAQPAGPISTYTDTLVTNETRYEVTMDLGDGLVAVNNSNTGVTEVLPVDDFLMEVTVLEAPVGEYQRNDTVTYNGKTVECMIYMDQQIVGGATYVTTYDWIGVDTNIIYRTEVTVNTSGNVSTSITELRDTNMIQQGTAGDIYIPETPSMSNEIRTQLQPGDYIEFSKYEGHYDREVERLVVESVNGDMVTVREAGDDDRDRVPVSDFLSLVRYNETGTPIGTETISTAFGNYECNVYEMDWKFSMIFDADWEDRIVVWADSSTGTIYKIESQEDYFDHDDRWDDWYDDIESYYLTGTSLLSLTPSSGEGNPGDSTDPVNPGDSTEPPVPSDITDTRYNVTLLVGDSYTIQDGRETTIYEIVAIDNGRLMIKETEGYDVDYDWESTYEFLNDILITESQLSSMYEVTGTTDTVNGVPCTVYIEKYDRDPDAISVQQIDGTQNYIIWEKNEDLYETETLTSLDIASLA